MSVFIAASLPPALPVSRSAPLPGGAAAAAVQPAGCVEAGRIQPACTTGPARIAPPAWPGPGTLNLAGELLDLSTTTIAYTGTITLPDTGADFWAMLATALPGRERE